MLRIETVNHDPTIAYSFSPLGLRGQPQPPDQHDLCQQRIDQLTAFMRGELNHGQLGFLTRNSNEQPRVHNQQNQVTDR